MELLPDSYFQSNRMAVVGLLCAILPVFSISGCDPPMIMAVSEGNTQTVNQLIAQGTDVNVVSIPGATALMVAVSYDHRDIVKLLLDKGANVNIVSRLGMTALMYAAYGGHVDMVKLLLDRGADASIATPSGKTALSIAESKGYQQIANLIQSSLAKKSQAPLVTATPLTPHPSPLPQGERETKTVAHPKAVTADWW